MAVDYLSTLNTKGSGINITQLVDSLVQAETEPKKALVQDKLDKETVSISEMTKLRSELVALSTVLSTGDTGQSYSLTSSDSSVGVAVTDYTKVTAVTSSVDVNTLASSQVLEFGNFTSSTAVLSPPANTNLSAAYASGGTNSTQPTFAVSGGGTTAASLAVSGADSTFEVGDVHNITVDGVTIPVTMTSSETNATTAATKIRDTINTWAAAHSDATSLYVATTDGSTINLVKKDAITLSFGTWSGSGFARKATTASGAPSAAAAAAAAA
ncbi:MAG: flagellar cap protein FliD N-terminal domain-containing protein, partial [Paracoccaceae bacterium]